MAFTARWLSNHTRNTFGRCFDLFVDELPFLHNNQDTECHIASRMSRYGETVYLTFNDPVSFAVNQQAFANRSCRGDVTLLVPSIGSHTPGSSPPTVNTLS
jgi:hypothetical protein